MQRREGWYQRKSYPHFDLPLPFEAAKKICEAADEVARNSFLPFICFEDKQRRFQPLASPKKYKNKIRELRYPSHRDGYIYSFYAKVLQDKYESLLSMCVWSKSVLGYRSGIGSNVDQAIDAFKEIASRGDCTAVAMDVSDFFPSIDHSILLKNLKSVLELDRLPNDWYAIFKSMTKFAWIERDTLLKVGGFPDGKLPKPIADIKQFREWRKSHKDFVCVNRKSYGIPQGSQISAVMSNVFMIEFDESVFQFVSSFGASYRRYSDDILIICDSNDSEEIIKFVEEELGRLGGKICISKEKTEVCKFGNLGGIQTCDRPLTYLGLTFDSKRTKLRDRTLSRYYRRMTYATRRTASVANKCGSPPFKRDLYRSLSHLGRNNFYSYAKRVAVVADDATPKQQLRRHMKVLLRKLNRRGK